MTAETTMKNISVQSTASNSPRRFAFSLSHLTIAKKMALIAAVAVTLCFIAIVAISAQGTKASLVDLGDKSYQTITQLISNNVAGGLRWNKADAVEDGYKSFVTAEGSAIASLRTFNKSGETVTKFDSKELPTYDLSQALEWSKAAESER